MQVYRTALIASFIFAIIGVIIGAFGAHKLKEVLAPDILASFETGVRYQFYHVFALAIAGLLYMAFPSPKIMYATWLFIVGIIMFSGSIYLLTYIKGTQDIGLGKLGLITPIGGLLLILGWVMLLLSVLGRRN